jgi:DNA helicase-4
MLKTIAKDYLNSEKLIQDRYPKLISSTEIQELQREWVSSIFEDLDVDEPDKEQIDAIGATEPRVLVTARAGSGKTRTIVNRAIFLNKFCGIAPSEILILAFNKTAAAEVKRRLVKFSTDFNACHVMTFHALAYSIVHPEETLIMASGERSGGKLLLLDDIVKSLLKSKKFSSDIMQVMLEFFRTDWHQVKSGGWYLLNDTEQFINFRRGLSNESMRGEPIKSLGEKVIADFLFQKGIDYKYEKYFKWNRPYRPDFTIEVGKDSGIIIEYFGMKGDPEYDQEILAKQEYWASKEGWTLLSYYPRDLVIDSLTEFETRISGDLDRLGIEMRDLTDEELWEKIEDRGTYKFTSAVSAAIGQIRKRNYTSQEFSHLVSQYSTTDHSEELFLRLLVRIYDEYLEYLSRDSRDDFDGLVNRAIEMMKSGKTDFARKDTAGDLTSLKSIFIDEFQDFSEQFFKLTNSALLANPAISLFCVGDDWQAINSFMGSELKYFTSFSEYFGAVTQYKLLTNYRSGTQIVDLSNAVMQGLGKASVPDSIKEGSIRLAELTRRNVSPSENESFQGDRLTPAVIKMLIQLDGKHSVAVLSHNRVNMPYFTRVGNQRGINLLERFENKVKSSSGDIASSKVTFTTVHGFKGNEADVVIFLDPIQKSFPSIHNTWRLQRIFGVTHEALEEEELRLLYVALSRPAKILVLVCNEIKELSQFLSDVISVESLVPIDWARLDEIGVEEVVVVVWSNGSGTREISKFLSSSKFFFNTKTAKWSKYIRSSEFSITSLQKSDWGQLASEVFVSIQHPDKSPVRLWKIQNGAWSEVSS